MANLELRVSSDPKWAACIIENFDEFLVDHADCERKATALALSLVVKYGDRPDIVEPMITLAKEELAHFQEVSRLLLKRGLAIKPNEKDPYVKALTKQIRHGEQDYFVDKLLVSGVIEARGCERFATLSRALEAVDQDMAKFYGRLAREEAGHFRVFYRSACRYFDPDSVTSRAEELLDIEAKVMESLAIRPAVH